LISNINPNEENPIYEMHDVISQKILEINGERGNRNHLENIITKFLDSIPKTVIKSQVFREAPTIWENLDIIAKNAIKYDINIYKLLELNLQLITLYVNTSDLYNSKILVDWFDKNEEEGRFKLWSMTNNEKGIYARYLGVIGWYYRRCSDHRQALDYYARELKIYDTITGFEASKCNSYFGLAVTNISLGNVRDAEKNIQKMEEMFDKNLVDKTDIATLICAKAVLCFIQGKYEEGLEYMNKARDIYLNNGVKVNDLFLTNLYLFRAETLNILGRYEDADSQVAQLMHMHKLSNKKNSKVFGRIYTQLAKSELGLGVVGKAAPHIKEAIDLLASVKSSNPHPTGVSEDPDLAAAYVVQGDVLFAQSKLKEAIESYRDAQKIYFYLYKNNINNVAQVSYLYMQGAKASCKAKDVYHYKCFGEPQVKEFGREHPNTIAMYEYCKKYNMDLWKAE
jgi:tetratricopeptide (TPR) repeat protein